MMIKLILCLLWFKIFLGVYFLFFLFGNLDYGMILRFIIIVVDKGFLFLIGIIYVDIIYKEVIIMIIIIIVVFFIYNFWDDSGVVVVFFIVMVLGDCY